jgi:hypothetical protein
MYQDKVMGKPNRFAAVKEDGVIEIRNRGWRMTPLEGRQDLSLKRT